jgi:Protein of unknown function (DUF2804).
MIQETELTAPVALTDARGNLNRAAVGYTRAQVHDTSGVTRRAWGRNKRWEYWSVIGPRFLVSITVSAVDYAGVQEVWVFDRESGRQWHGSAIMPFARGVELPGSLGGGPARVATKNLSATVEPVGGGAWRLTARIPGVEVDLLATPPAGSEALGVVVPWSSTRFQYTVKAVAIPTTGTVRLDGAGHAIDAGGPAWGVLDHGRGRWPYDVRWNWAAGSGVVDGRRVGIQLGAQWTAGTGATENALFVDGRLHKISEELAFDYDTTDYLKPWHVRGERADLVLTPFHDKVSRTALGVISTRTDQCFGHWTGWMATDAGERVRVDGAVGFAEDVHNRW